MATNYSAKMRLLDVLLKKQQTSLFQLIREARTRTADKPRIETWDDIAFRIRALTGERVVRETVINYAMRLGIKPYRALRADEEIHPPSDDDSPQPAQVA